MGQFLTQSDVAKACRVSRSTVAAVLQNRPSTSVISPTTRHRVIEAARRMNYRPNFAAHSLRSRRTHTLALTIPNFSAVKGTMQIQKLQGLGQRAQELGYTVVLCGYEERSDLRTTFANLVREGRFDGVIFHGDMRHDLDEREVIFKEINIPNVVLEKTTPRSSCVDFDHVWGGAAATRHLLKAGRQRIGFIGRSDNQIPFRKRYEGYQSALAEAGIPCNRQRVTDSTGRLVETGQRGARQLLERGMDVDALVCVSDEGAMAAIQILAKAGLSIPGAVAVVGYDDAPMAAIANPALTTIRQDGVAMGRLAVDMLHRQIEAEGALPPEQYTLRPELVIRDSCGASRSNPSTFQGDRDELTLG
jgi:DNA-binding LacI/PurR family transcriptional regulator